MIRADQFSFLISLGHKQNVSGATGPAKKHIGLTEDEDCTDQEPHGVQVRCQAVFEGLHIFKSFY